MKKIIFSLILLVAISANAQEKDYNQWSIEAGAGFNKPVRAWTSNYSTETVSPYTFNVGARYMFNEFVGLKAMFSYDNIKSADNTPDFESKFYSYSLEGVANLGRIMKFESWTKTLNVLGHAGLGYSRLAPETGIYNDAVDQMVNFRGGVTGEIKLSDKFALTGDVSVLANIRQNLTWNGGVDNHSSIQGVMFNGTVGLVYYLGKAKEHADWYLEENTLRKELDSLNQRLTLVEYDMKDSDNDGIANYLDQEPNTVANAVVDSKGRAVDVNNDGIPDAMLAPLDARYASKGDTQGGNIIKELIDNGYVNVYFRFNSTIPEDYSLQSVNYLIIYMNEHPGSKAELIGYADELGDASYNQKLSEKRANKVQELLVAAGIDASRLTVRGGGEDASVDKNSTGARQLVRRVTFKLK